LNSAIKDLLEMAALKPKSTSKPTSKNSQKQLTVELMWQLQRLGAPSISPDGAQVVCAVAQPSVKENTIQSAIWLLSTLGGEPRQLTQCGDKDGRPQFSPQGDWVAFVAKREQNGKKDDEPQLYLIPPDGGEAKRAGEVATGVVDFKWFPDGKRIAFITWAWPKLKGTSAQAEKLKETKARKDSAYATEDAVYRHWDHNLPMGRVPHLCIMDVVTGAVVDLLEGTDYELPRREPSANEFDISPDGQKITFVFDPDRAQNAAPRMALAEIELKGSKPKAIRELVKNKAWDLSGPAYSPTGQQLAFLASHQALKHTQPNHLALLELKPRGTSGQKAGAWKAISAKWDREPQMPLKWSEDGAALLCKAEDKGRQHVWRFDIAKQTPSIVAEGGTVHAFDEAAGQLVTLTDRAIHPGRLHVLKVDESGQIESAALKRIEHFNDDLLADVALGQTEEHWFKGAQGDDVQVWLHFPPGFNKDKKHPLLHTIHGGPHTGPGDVWHWRWNYHVFAAQGYVVANVNYHGSSGFGLKFLDSITHQWGQLELQDMEASTDWLRKKPWIAKDRVFATGGSYGGYMVAWMNAHVKPGRYQAYVCHAGCFDWVGMFSDDAYGWHAQELGGWYWNDIKKVHAQSPHAYAATMQTPTLVIHGAKDYRVPDAQGLAYYNTLKAKGVDARLLWYPDENHWILKPANNVIWYHEFFDWIKRYDPAFKKKQ
jgi:dipeptidyl aminopeptidase/acylaminoacyl peptidase